MMGLELRHVKGYLKFSIRGFVRVFRLNIPKNRILGVTSGLLDS